MTQQSVEVHVQHLLQLVQVHDGDLLGNPHILAQAEIGGTPQRISDEASRTLAVRHTLELKASGAINLCAHDGSVGTGIQHERGGVTIHFALDDNQGLHGPEGNSDRAGMRGIGHWRQEEQHEDQRMRERQGTSGTQRNTRAYPAACVQNGGAAGSSRTKCAMVKCVQIKLSANDWRADVQQFSLHDATVGQRRKAIYPFAAFEFELRCVFRPCFTEAASRICLTDIFPNGYFSRRPRPMLVSSRTSSDRSPWPLREDQA